MTQRMTPKRKELIVSEVSRLRGHDETQWVCWLVDELFAELKAVEQERDLVETENGALRRLAGKSKERAENAEKSCDLLRRRVEGLSDALNICKGWYRNWSTKGRDNADTELAFNQMTEVLRSE